MDDGCVVVRQCGAVGLVGSPLLVLMWPSVLWVTVWVVGSLVGSGGVSDSWSLGGVVLCCFPGSVVVGWCGVRGWWSYGSVGGSTVIDDINVGGLSRPRLHN